MARNTSYWLIPSQIGGQIYSLIANKRLDEPNEQKAIKAGYENYIDK